MEDKVAMCEIYSKLQSRRLEEKSKSLREDVLKLGKLFDQAHPEVGDMVGYKSGLEKIASDLLLMEQGFERMRGFYVDIAQDAGLFEE